MDGKIISTNVRGVRSSSAARTMDQVHRYKRLLGTYWWILVLTTGLSLGVGWVLLKGRPLSYVSSGRMTLNVKLALPNTTSVYSDEQANFFGTQVELMQSSTVQNRVSLRLREQLPLTRPVPVSIQVGMTPKTSIFNLTAEGTDPDYVHEYLKATMEEYVKLKRELVDNASSTTTSSLQKDREFMLAQLQASKDALFNYQSSNSVVFLQNSGDNAAASYMAVLSRQLSERKSELQLLMNLSLDENLEREQAALAQQSTSAQLAPLHHGAGPNSTNAADSGSSPASSAPGQSNAGDNQSANNASDLAYGIVSMPGTPNEFGSAYLQTKQLIFLLQAKKKELSEYMRPMHPDMVALDDEITTEQRRLAIFEEESRQELTKHQHVLEAQIKELTTELKEWEAKAVDSSRKLAEFEALKLNCTRLQTLCDQLQGSLQTLEISKGIGQETVAIFEAAGPAVAVPPRLPLRLALAGFLGLILGIGVVLTRHHFDDRPGSLMELEDLLGLPVIAQIPFLKVKNKKLGLPLIEMNDDRHMLVESYNNLRSALLFKDSPNGKTKSIVITSPAPGDGKTMVCANLAISLAHSGARVLLVDADLRRGQMHNRFSIREQPGLAEVLAEKCGVSEAVVHTAIPNLDLLPCGTPPVRPASLLIGRIKKLLEQMNGKYDYFIFDSAPVLAADDVSSLAPQVDGVLMVIRAGSTYGRFAKSALDLLYLRKVNVIGLVFNGVNPKAREYSCYQYEEYYSPPAQPEELRRTLNG